MAIILLNIQSRSREANVTQRRYGLAASFFFFIKRRFVQVLYVHAAKRAGKNELCHQSASKGNLG